MTKKQTNKQRMCDVVAHSLHMAWRELIDSIKRNRKIVPLNCRQFFLSLPISRFVWRTLVCWVNTNFNIAWCVFRCLDSLVFQRVNFYVKEKQKSFGFSFFLLTIMCEFVNRVTVFSSTSVYVAVNEVIVWNEDEGKRTLSPRLRWRPHLQRSTKTRENRKSKRILVSVVYF